MRARIAVVIGLVVFLVLAGTGVSFAYWTAQASASGTVAAADLSAPCTNPGTNQVALVNGGFEDPNIGTDAYRQIGSPFITGWSVADDNVIEVWRSQLQNMGAGAAPEGAQVVELNGNAPGTIYQVVATTPGQTLYWSLKHRGRFGTDTMRVSINANGAALVQQDQFSTGTTAWSTHQGAYVVPAGQTSTRISLTAVSSAPEAGQNNGPSVGNLVDDVTFGSSPCLAAASTIRNVTTSGTTYKVGDVVEYTTTITNSGGAHATASVFTANVPTGLSYVAGSLQINGVAKSDTAGNDEGEVVTGVVTARLGQGATATTGGAIPPANSVTVTFRGTVQASAAGTSLSYSSSTAYADALAPTWGKTAISPTLTTPVTAASSTLVATVSSATILNTGAATWVFHLVNNGPGASVGTNVAINSGALTGVVVQQNVSGTWVTCTTGCQNIGALANGASVDIRVTGTATGANNSSFTVSATATATNMTGTSVASRAVVLDKQAPAAPTGLKATRASSSSIGLTWTAGTPADNVGVTGYYIYRNGVKIDADPSATSYTDSTGLTAGTPYWYWVVAHDAAGNVSGQSTGDGAVTYANNTSYRIVYPYGTVNAQNPNGLCLAAENNDGKALLTQSCDTTPANRQWMFETYNGDDVYVRFATGDNRRWISDDDNSDTDLEISSMNDTTNARSRWNLGAYWDGTNAWVEMRRTTVNALCLDISSANQAPGGVVQQWTCNQTVAQRFLLRQP